MTVQNYMEEINRGCRTFAEQYDRGTVSVKDLLDLKKAVSFLNNLIAVEQELLFLDQIQSPYDRKRLGKPNANGYDVYDPKQKVVAELKGMLPCLRDGSFGSQQREQIQKDLDGLVDSKKKAQGLAQGFDKYIVLFDGTQEAMARLLKNAPDFERQAVNGEEQARHISTGEAVKIVYINQNEKIPNAHLEIDLS